MLIATIEKLSSQWKWSWKVVAYLMGVKMAEDDLPVLEKKMKQMMKFKEHLFKDAKANIDQAQSRYKQDYDRKRSASEVFVDCIHNFTQMLM